MQKPLSDDVPAMCGASLCSDYIRMVHSRICSQCVALQDAYVVYIGMQTYIRLEVAPFFPTDNMQCVLAVLLFPLRAVCFALSLPLSQCWFECVFAPEDTAHRILI